MSQNVPRKYFLSRRLRLGLRRTFETYKIDNMCKIMEVVFFTLNAHLDAFPASLVQLEAPYFVEKNYIFSLQGVFVFTTKRNYQTEH